MIEGAKRNLRILITDDSRTVRKVIAKTLELCGVHIEEIFEAATGREALAMIEQHSIDLMFLDLHMPDMDGDETIEVLGELDRLDDICVVMVSSDRSRERIDELMRRGVRAFIIKPFKPEDIRSAVEALLPGGVK